MGLTSHSSFRSLQRVPAQGSRSAPGRFCHSIRHHPGRRRRSRSRGRQARRPLSRGAELGCVLRPGPVPGLGFADQGAMGGLPLAHSRAPEGGRSSRSGPISGRDASPRLSLASELSWGRLPRQAESRSRPLARRALRIARPARVFIRARKPCLRFRRRLLG